jgi:hypothetical protein
MQGTETGPAGGVGNSEPSERDRDTALGEYVQETVRNLWRLASRNGMSQTRFADLIQDWIN